MSQFQTNKEGNVIKTVYVLPSQCEWNDIEQLERHNRGANEPKENLDELMASVKARKGFVTPLKGYINGTGDEQSIMITAGSRRLAVGQALESEGEVYNLPVTLISKPKTKEQIVDALLDSDVDNNFRNADSDIVRHATYSILREEGLSLKEIGARTGVSHTHVANTLKVFTLEPLKVAIESGKLSVRAATEYVGEKYQKHDANNKPVTEVIVNDEGKKIRRPVYDVEKIKKDLGNAGQAAKEAGKGKIGATTARASAEPKDEFTGMKAVKIILDEPEDNIPTTFRAFCRWLNGNLDGIASLKSWAKKNKMDDEFEWLFDIEFNIKKRAIQKDREAEAAKKAKGKKSAPTNKGKKTEEEELESDEYE